jgi:hypothetical protein
MAYACFWNSSASRMWPWREQVAASAMFSSQIYIVELGLDVALPHRLEVARLLVEHREARVDRGQLGVVLAGHELQQVLGGEQVLRGGGQVAELRLQDAQLEVVHGALL